MINNQEQISKICSKYVLSKSEKKQLVKDVNDLYSEDLKIKKASSKYTLSALAFLVLLQLLNEY